LIVLSIILLPGSIPPLATPAAIAAATITAEPGTLTASVPLGQATTRAITLANHTTAALTPTIREVYPDAAPAPARQLLAPELRAVPLPRQGARVEPKLIADLEAAPDRHADFFVFLHDQADLSAAYAIGDWAERGRYVFRTLSKHAERSQSRLRAQLMARGLRFKPLWIANAVLVHGDMTDVQVLSSNADVALVRANHSVTLAPQAPAPDAVDRCSPDQPGNPICWNIRKIGADRVWKTLGVTGRGIVVANIDTGVQFDHPALAAQYRGYQRPGRFDHNYNWFDPQGIEPAPVDSLGHGTHTIGTIVGAGDGTLDRPSVGVAPGARWIAAQGCTQISCSDRELLESAQWMLAPTDLAGRQPRPELRPMIVNNSWANNGGDTLYSGYVAAWRAAGIFPVFAAGNSGLSGCGSVGAPADFPNVVGVGATTVSDAVASFSSRGPAHDGHLKPDFAAPGQMIFSTYLGNDGAYATLDGTSMATPHVGGVVALLWSANPALIGDYDATYAILRDTALRLSDTQCGDRAGTPNNVSGYGRVDAYAAVSRARIDIPWMSTAPAPAIAANGIASLAITLDAAKVPGPGTYSARLQLYGADLSQPPTTIGVTMTVTSATQQGVITGRVVSADTGAPVAATVGVKDGLGVPTDGSGAYKLILATGSYELVARAPAFFEARTSLVVTGDQQAPNIVMRPDQPHLALPIQAISQQVSIGRRAQTTLPIANSGTQPLYYQARVLPDKFAALRSDEAGGPDYRWVDLPSSAPKLTLKDNSYKDDIPLRIEFPFYNYTLTQTLVTSNGTLAFFLPLGPYGSPNEACLPDHEYGEIAPFRADLDPSRGGTVRYGTVDDGTTFVLSYEKVPLHTGPLDQTYTFQVLLHADGRIVFQYRRLARLPSLLAVGVQWSINDYMALGCGVASPIHDGLAIELQPQLDASTWLHVDGASGTLPPAAERRITVKTDWIRPDATSLRARIELTSNDPIRARLVVPVQVTMVRAPHELLFPFIPGGGWYG
jgi:subtilisin family serine protease